MISKDTVSRHSFTHVDIYCRGGNVISPCEDFCSDLKVIIFTQDTGRQFDQLL